MDAAYTAVLPQADHSSILTMAVNWLVVLGSCLLVQYCVVVSSVRVLVFGGNGFMGAATVRLLLQRSRFSSITIVNRGNWYWDDREAIEPFVRRVRCDRYSPGSLVTKCPELVAKLKEETFDFVIDFSAFNGKAIDDSLRFLKLRQGGVYVYISSDSVYEVCERRQNSGPSVESDAVRVAGRFREILEGADPYGHGKLEAEEALQNGRVPYINLRLPDVIGPRDTLHRLWRYLLWIRVSASMNKPIPIPAVYLNRQMSMVYSQDVAELIVKFVSDGRYHKNETLLNKAYNLACRDTISLYRLLEMAMELLGHDNVEYRVDQSNSFYLYPSVNVGPVSISRAETHLDWKPTLLANVIKITVEFFERVMREANDNESFGWNKRQVMQRLKEGPFADSKSTFERKIEEIYARVKNREEL